MKKLAQIGLLQAFVAQMAAAQQASSLKNCWNQRTASYWCVPKDGSQADGATS